MPLNSSTVRTCTQTRGNDFLHKHTCMLNSVNFGDNRSQQSYSKSLLLKRSGRVNKGKLHKAFVH